MNFDANSLLLSFFVSGIGYVLFRYGRKQERVPQLIVGVSLMVFPYFVSDVAWMAAITVVLIGLFFLSMKLGL